MRVTAFVDETGVDGPRVLLAGLVARNHHWHGFRNQWARMLRAAQIPYSHITEMRKADPPFEGWTEERINCFTVKAAQIIENYCSFGLTVGVDKTVRAKYADTMPPRTSPDSAYGMCARQFFEKVPRYVERIMGIRHAKIDFVFEQNEQHFGDAVRIFSDLKVVSPDLRDVLGTIASGSREAFVALQAADMLAFGARRKEPHTTFLEMPSSGALVNSRFRKCPIIRTDIGSGAIQTYHEVAAEIARRKRFRKRMRRM